MSTPYNSLKNFYSTLCHSKVREKTQLLPSLFFWNLCGVGLMFYFRRFFFHELVPTLLNSVCWLFCILDLNPSPTYHRMKVVTSQLHDLWTYLPTHSSITHHEILLCLIWCIPCLSNSSCTFLPMLFHIACSFSYNFVWTYLNPFLTIFPQSYMGKIPQVWKFLVLGITCIYICVWNQI